ncbi:MAG: hypothetical protein K0S11_539 [Gammaproteobacteria bacterium]|nr:hypothetical protein [Gammaproteobacteria bacterium]
MSLVFTILMGAQVPIPITPTINLALKRIEVIHNDTERSGFQLSFALGRKVVLGEADYSLLQEPQLQPFNRVFILITWQGMTTKLMDGIITHLQVNPGDSPGAGELMVTGEDISLLMDQEEKIVAHPAQSDDMIVNQIIANYAQYGLIPQVVPPANSHIPDPIDYIPMQYGTDWVYLQELAQRHGYVFYVASESNTAYWGPPQKSGRTQDPLTINLANDSNAFKLNFKHRILAPATYTTWVQDVSTNQISSLTTKASNRQQLARQAALEQSHRLLQLQGTSGLSYAQAQALAQAKTDLSTDNVVTAEGELDVTRYGKPLQARGLVEVRGAGNKYNGKYYVKRVIHSLQTGSYQQQFLLSREGTGAVSSHIL